MMFRENNPELKAKMKALVIEEKTPFFLGKFEEQVKNNRGYLVDGKVG